MPRILVCEDDPASLHLISLNLRQRGYEIVIAADGARALDLFEQGQFDLLMLDAMMAGMNGYEVCERIRRISDVPIIFVTARADNASREAAFRQGASDYLVKPFSVDDLLECVRSALPDAGL